MNAHVVSYPSLQRRVMVQRRTRALFLRRTTQHVNSRGLLLEIGRAAVALTAVVAWGALIVIAAF